MREKVFYSNYSRKRTYLIGSIFAAIVAAISYQTYGLHASGKIWNPYDETRTGCGKDYPILVTVKNWTFKRLTSASLNIEVWRNGISDNILQNKDYFVFNRILPPFTMLTVCYTDPLFDYSKINLKSSNSDLEDTIKKSNMILPELAKLSESSEVNVTIFNSKFH